jgi:hypothetical protein
MVTEKRLRREHYGLGMGRLWYWRSSCKIVVERREVGCFGEKRDRPSNSQAYHLEWSQ